MFKKMILATSLLGSSMFAEQALHESHKVNPNKELTEAWKEKLYNDTEQKVYRGEELYYHRYASRWSYGRSTLCAW